MLRDKSNAIAAVCQALSHVGTAEAATLLRRDYRFAPEGSTRHRLDPVQWTRVFLRDGFIDRYTGSRLVFPPVLRILSMEMPQDFPFHPNWKTDATHPAYWELSATIDHRDPRSRGGPADDDNLVTTSMARNSAKGNWTLEELGWEIKPVGRLEEWDGLLSWFLDFTRERPKTLETSDVRRWQKAAVALWRGV